jgi:IS30 family transposase
MVKKMELTIDEKVKIQVWTEAGMKTAAITSKLGRGESTICRFRAEIKELPPGSSLPCI